jgi:hypothetical protein
VLAAVTLWTMRRFIFTGGIPAGTDMLGFVSRAASNAAPGRLIDAWSPSSFGDRRIFSFDNILGALTLLLRNPMVTVKLLDVLTLFGAGAAAYALGWYWYRRPLVAALTGLLFMASQASLTRWGSGQLNVEIVTALAPVMLLVWSSCLDRFTIGRAVRFTLVIGAGCLVRPDLVLYVVPFGILYAAVVLTVRGRLLVGLARAAGTLAVAVPSVLLLNAAWLVPTLTGYHAQYETLSQIFSTQQLSTRSLDLYPSLLGFGREIGYFGFTGTETWYSYPGLPLWAYYALASVIPLLAYSALRWHRDRHAVFLVLAAVLATLAAPGGRAPLGPAYLWFVRNVPIVSNLRDPNRWLIVQALAYALLASLTIEHIVAAARHWSLVTPSRTRIPVLSGAIVVGLAGLGLGPVSPTLAIGLRTWHVTHPQQALLDRLRNMPGPGRVASVPFDQDYRFVVQGTYRGYEHDLGYESSLFTGRPDVGDGSWDQRSADFIAYEAGLLARRDPAFAALLASAGVSHLVSFRYPLVAPQLLSRSVGAFSQQYAVSGLAGLVPLLSNRAGTDYSITGAAAPLSLRRNIAVVLGGSQGVAALADRPGIRLADWAVFTADDLIESGGYAELLAMIRRAGLVLLADERPVDIAVEGTRPLAKLTGFTSDPQLDRLETDVPTDQSAQTGSLTDVTAPIPLPGLALSSSVFSVHAPQQVEIWARVMATPLAATIQARVDGRRAGSVTPVTLGHGGFEWLRLAVVHVGAGVHRVTISTVRSKFGDGFEVTEARVVAPAALRNAEGQLNRSLAARTRKIGYVFQFADVAKWSWAALAHRLRPAKAPAFATPAWGVPAGARTLMTAQRAPGGRSAAQFTASGGRSVYTVATLRYARPLNWANRPYIYLKFQGNGSGKTYVVVFDFGGGPKNQARYLIRDSSSSWKTFAFSTADPGPGSGITDWAQVRSVRIALLSKQEAGTFAVGVPRPSRSVSALPVRLPVLHGTRKFGAAVRQPECAGGAHVHPPRWLASRRTLLLPVSGLHSPCRIYVGSRAGYHQVPATAVPLYRNGIESWSYAVSSPGSGVLVWTQAYDPLWRLSGTGSAGTPLPVQSLLNGYLVGPGPHRGSIAFTGESSTVKGIAVTAFAAVLLLPIAMIRRRRGRHTRTVPQVRPPSSRPVRGGRLSRWLLQLLRRTLDCCVKSGPWLLVLCPIATLAGLGGLLLPLSLGALLASGTAALLAPAVPVGGSPQDPDAAGPGQDAGNQAEPGTVCAQDGADLAGPGSGVPAGPPEVPGEPEESPAESSDDSGEPAEGLENSGRRASAADGRVPAKPGQEWVLDGVRS